MEGNRPRGSAYLVAILLLLGAFLAWGGGLLYNDLRAKGATAWIRALQARYLAEAGFQHAAYYLLRSSAPPSFYVKVEKMGEYEVEIRSDGGGYEIHSVGKTGRSQRSVKAWVAVDPLPRIPVGVYSRRPVELLRCDIRGPVISAEEVRVGDFSTHVASAISRSVWDPFPALDAQALEAWLAGLHRPAAAERSVAFADSRALDFTQNRSVLVLGDVRLTGELRGPGEISTHGSMELEGSFHGLTLTAGGDIRVRRGALLKDCTLYAAAEIVLEPGASFSGILAGRNSVRADGARMGPVRILAAGSPSPALELRNTSVEGWILVGWPGAEGRALLEEMQGSGVIVVHGRTEISRGGSWNGSLYTTEFTGGRLEGLRLETRLGFLPPPPPGFRGGGIRIYRWEGIL